MRAQLAFLNTLEALWDLFPFVLYLPNDNAGADPRVVLACMQNKTRWPSRVLEEGSQLLPDASFPDLIVLAHACLRCDFPLPAGLLSIRVAVARPWQFLDRVILLCREGGLPELLDLRISDLDESLPWAPPQQLRNWNCLQNSSKVETLLLPPFKARPSKAMSRMQQYIVIEPDVKPYIKWIPAQFRPLRFYLQPLDAKFFPSFLYGVNVLRLVFVSTVNLLGSYS